MRIWQFSTQQHRPTQLAQTPIKRLRVLDIAGRGEKSLVGRRLSVRRFSQRNRCGKAAIAASSKAAPRRSSSWAA
ncbi:MAG TPA: hypothetical protein VNF04_00005, partial [Stellaceae bacterium]|nr:hypothetical protein [Stellaceae bacterium]